MPAACCLDLDGDVPVDDGGGEEPAKAWGKRSLKKKKLPFPKSITKYSLKPFEKR
jgi:hypothetical protein